MDESTPGELKADANAILAWLKSHPKTVVGVLCLLAGFVLGKAL